MTVSEDYTDDGFDTPSYPTAFGITFTPNIFGILAALIGLGVAAYVGTQLVLPQVEQSRELKVSIDQKEAELALKTNNVKQQKQLLASLNKIKAKPAEVRGLFSDKKALDTLLLDLSRVIQKSGASLLTFTPNDGSSGVVSDSSLGSALNFKLKRQVTDVSFEGSFAETLEIMQSIDTLQTVLVVQDLDLSVKENEKDVFETLMTSKFKLHAYVPLTPEEIAAAQAEQAKAAKDEKK